MRIGYLILFLTLSCFNAGAQNQSIIYDWWTNGESEESPASIVEAFKARVAADGGVVEAEQHLVDEIQHLKDVGVWDKLSAAWIPSGYAEGKLYAVKGGPEADLDFSRAGTRTRVGPTGLIEHVPHNLVANSETFATNWSNGFTAVDADQVPPSGFISASLLETRTTSPQAVTPLVPVGAGVYTIRQRFKAGTGEWVYLQLQQMPTNSVYGRAFFNVSTGEKGGSFKNGTDVVVDDWYIKPLDNGFYECTVHITYTGAESLRYVFGVGSSNGNAGGVPTGTTIITTGAQWNIGNTARPYFRTTNRQNVPAIEFYNGPPSLNLEKASTNLLRSSNDFGNSTYWTNANSIGITPFSISSPTGTLSGVKLTESDNTANHQIVQGIGKDGSALQYTLSVYAKKAERNWIRLQVSESANGVRAWFNLDTGEVGTTLTYGAGFTLDGVRVRPHADGWYRCEVTCTSSTNTNLNSVIAIQEQDNYTSYAGDGESGIYVYQAQLEQGAYATSDIPTEASTASRIADAIFSTSISGVGSKGSLFFDGWSYADGTSKCFGLSDGTNTNRLVFTFLDGNVIRAWTTANSTQRNINTNVPFSTGERVKLALTWIDNVASLFINGVKAGSLTNFDMPQNLTVMRSSVNSAGVLPFYGGVNNLAMFDYLSDDEAITLTTP